MFLIKLLLSLILSNSVRGDCPRKTADQCSEHEEFFISDYHPPTNNIAASLASPASVYRCHNTCQYYGRTFNCPVDKTLLGDCYCKKGYARLTECGPCVSVTTDSGCRAVLPPSEESCCKKSNEEFRSTGPKCPNDCLNANRVCPKLKTLCHSCVDEVQWEPVCECKEGYFRLPNGKCVAKDNAACVALYNPSKENCQRIGELYSPFGSACQGKCGDYEFLNICHEKKKPSESEGLKPACYCRKNTARNLLGKCVIC